MRRGRGCGIWARAGSRWSRTWSACSRQVSDLLACAWPAALGTAARPLESTTWLAAMGVVTDRCCGEPGRLRKMGYDRFVAAVRRELPRWGARNVCHKIVRGLWEALADAGGVRAQRRGALERVHLLMADRRSLLGRLAEVESRMCAVLDELGLTGLVTSIDGLSAVGAAVILAETGELSRFASARSVVKRACQVFGSVALPVVTDCVSPGSRRPDAPPNAAGYAAWMTKDLICPWLQRLVLAAARC